MGTLHDRVGDRRLPPVVAAGKSRHQGDRLPAMFQIRRQMGGEKHDPGLIMAARAHWFENEPQSDANGGDSGEAANADSSQ